MGRAVATSAKSPRTWGPFAAAAILAITGLDEDVSDRIATERPLFGSRAEKASDTLRDLSVAAFMVSALAVPDESAFDRLATVGAGATAVLASSAFSEELKGLTRRRRPDGDGLTSFPSGHATIASSAATLAARNLQHIEMSPGVRTGAAAGLEAVAIGTGWARVEARRHHVVDVLAGNAIGHFFSAFVHAAFIERRRPGATIEFRPIEGGGMVRVALPFRMSGGGFR